MSSNLPKKNAVGRTLDAVIVGSGVSAFTTAALLGRRGWRGLVVTSQPPEPAHHRSAWLFEDRRTEVQSRVFDTLGMQEEVRRTARPLEPGIRLISDDTKHRKARRRVELEAGESPLSALSLLWQTEVSKLTAEHRQVKSCTESMSSFLSDLSLYPDEGFFGKKKAQAIVQRYADFLSPIEASGEGLLSLGRRLAPLLTSSVSARMGPAACLSDAFLSGPRLAHAGRGLLSVLAERAERYGFEIHQGALSGLTPEGRRFRLSVSGRRTAEVSDRLIDCSPSLVGLEALPHQLRARRLNRPLEALRPAGFRVRFSYDLERSALPEALGNNAIYLPRPDTERALWISVDVAEDRARLHIESAVSVLEAREELATVENKVGVLIRRLIPQFERAKPKALPPTMMPLRSSRLDEHAGIAGVPVKTSCRGVWVASDSATLPGLPSLEASLHSAWQVVQAVSKGARAN